MLTRILIASSGLLFVGCATNLAPPPFTPDHPASAQAAEAPRPRAPRLTVDALTRATKSQLARHGAPEADDHPANPAMHQHMSGMEGMGAMPANTAPETKAMPESKASPAANDYWTCVMHPEIHADKPGQCPKCGMDLVKKEAPAK